MLTPENRIDGVGIGLEGGPGADTIEGTNARDRLEGGPGRDRLDALGGDDQVRIDDGEPDTLFCGPGFDTASTDAVETTVRDCETRTAVGTLRLAPKAVTAKAGQPAHLRLSWRHPKSWTSCARSSCGSPTARAGGRRHDPSAGGADQRRRRLAAGAQAQPARPQGKTVTARLAVRLDESLAGQTLKAEVEATDRRGARQLERDAGTVRVARSRRAVRAAELRGRDCGPAAASTPPTSSRRSRPRSPAPAPPTTATRPDTQTTATYWRTHREHQAPQAHRPACQRRGAARRRRQASARSDGIAHQAASPARPPGVNERQRIAILPRHDHRWPPDHRTRSPATAQDLDVSHRPQRPRRPGPLGVPRVPPPRPRTRPRPPPHARARAAGPCLMNKSLRPTPFCHGRPDWLAVATSSDKRQPEPSTVAPGPSAPAPATDRREGRCSRSVPTTQRVRRT